MQLFKRTARLSGALTLQAHSIVTLSGDAVLDVECGAVWVTAEGDGRDYVLTKGAHKAFKGRNLILEALRPTKVSVTR